MKSKTLKCQNLSYSFLSCLLSFSPLYVICNLDLYIQVYSSLTFSFCQHIASFQAQCIKSTLITNYWCRSQLSHPCLAVWLSLINNTFLSRAQVCSNTNSSCLLQLPEALPGAAPSPPFQQPGTAVLIQL